ncbi:MAG: hypothetical protein GY822_00365 [Deltaproteobacteria bacterium]|nr:hypothetical protein [Deltaproteobacteria bacterium]
MSLALVVAMGALTFFIRAIFVLGPKLSQERLRPFLRALPSAVMPALAVSSLLSGGDKLVSAQSLMAVLLGCVVAWRTKSVAAAMVLGMISFWGFRFLFQL